MNLTVLGVSIGILGVILALIGIVQNYTNKKRRVIRYGFSTRERIFSNPIFDNDNFDLQLNGKRVRDLFRLGIVIGNVGNETLYAKDFLEPLKFEFDRIVKIFPFRHNRLKQDI